MYFHLKWNNDVPLLSGEPSQYVYEYDGDILADDYSDCDNSDMIAGKFECRYVDVNRAIIDDYPILDVFDHSSELAEYYEHLFDMDDNQFKYDVNSVFDYEIFGANFLVISKLEILPAFRKNGLGLQVLDFIMTRFGTGASLILIKPFPLQFGRYIGHEDAWSTQLQFDSLCSDPVDALNKLKNYYSKIGFIQIADTPFMGKVP